MACRLHIKSIIKTIILQQYPHHIIFKFDPKKQDMQERPELDSLIRIITNQKEVQPVISYLPSAKVTHDYKALLLSF